MQLSRDGHAVAPYILLLYTTADWRDCSRRGIHSFSFLPNLPLLVAKDHWEGIRKKFSLLDLFDAQFFKPLQVVETDLSPSR